VIDFPGQEPATWDRFYIAQNGEQEPFTASDSVPPQSTNVVFLPTRALFAWPLWISAEGDALSLVKLELSGRHLLKRGMEDCLTALTVQRKEDRQLVIALTMEEPFPVNLLPEGWQKADVFEIPARLFEGTTGCDLNIWREQGATMASFQRRGQLVWFCEIKGEGGFGVLKRSALRLLSEGVIERSPHSIRIARMNSAESKRMAIRLQKLFPESQISCDEETMRFPGLPAPAVDLAPIEARHARDRRNTLRRFASIGGIVAGIYILLLIWGGGDLLIRQNALRHLKQKVAQIQSPSLEIKKESQRWNALRNAVDPATYPLDLLAAVAAPTEGGKVRLISFILEGGHLQISGEATDVTQAYSFIDKLKKTPSLQEYDWTAGQPQLAGKNSVKFDMEGTRHNAHQ